MMQNFLDFACCDIFCVFTVITVITIFEKLGLYQINGFLKTGRAGELTVQYAKNTC